jgi:hypothetical protein
MFCRTWREDILKFANQFVIPFHSLILPISFVHSIYHSIIFPKSKHNLLNCYRERGENSKQTTITLLRCLRCRVAERGTSVFVDICFIARHFYNYHFALSSRMEMDTSTFCLLLMQVNTLFLMCKFLDL